MQFPPISTFKKYYNYCSRGLDIWSIVCMRDDKIHHVKLTIMFSNVHTMPMLMAFLAKPMFRVNEPLFISEQTMVVMWQIFQGLSKNIFPCYLIISTLQKNTNNIP